MSEQQDSTQQSPHEEGLPTDQMINLYCVLDTLAENASPPFQAPNNAVALREFRLFSKKASIPADYDLLLVGRQDRTNGMISSLKPTLVASGRTLFDEDESAQQ